jgi:hypothetical protein
MVRVNTATAPGPRVLPSEVCATFSRVCSAVVVAQLDTAWRLVREL